MAKIETREALVEWIAGCVARIAGKVLSPYGTVREAREFLDALDAAGLVVCPKEPTREMVKALLSGLGPVMADDLALAIDASPYRKKP